MKRFIVVSTLVYLVMGWMAIIAIKPLYTALTGEGFALLLLGESCILSEPSFIYGERFHIIMRYGTLSCSAAAPQCFSACFSTWQKCRLYRKRRKPGFHYGSLVFLCPKLFVFSHDVCRVDRQIDINRSQPLEQRAFFHVFRTGCFDCNDRNAEPFG